MKTRSILFLALFICSAGAQQPREDSLQAKQAQSQLAMQPIINEEKPNEITNFHLTYSGIVVEVIKTKKPLELINPAAPDDYGWAENNVVRDPIDRHVSGLKIFSIEF